MNPKNKIVFVAMSGGVDSSVAAALLKKAGFSVVGVFMKPWQNEILNSDCLWKEDREDAMLVASKLEIPLLTWDFSKEYEKYVVRYLIDGYKNGITPNPDIMCNKFIKFGLFLKNALDLGADYVATGHYVRKFSISSSKLDDPLICNYGLAIAKDKNKDQSYFLYHLTQDQLKHCLFPIGSYLKTEVRKLAKNFGLANWAKKDSQGVCFIGKFKIDEFLRHYIKEKRGLVVRVSDGKILGEHNGIWYYTIGQRHFGLSGGKPYFIVAKDIEKNILYVEEKGETKEIQYFEIKDSNWIEENIKLPLNCEVKLRYRQKEQNCTIFKNNGSIQVKLYKKNFVAPGQAAVFYQGEKLLGGGIIQLLRN